MSPSVFEPPTLGIDEVEVLDLIDRLRDDLRFRVAVPNRWVGTLRRTAFARAVQASNSIEGYNASLDDVAAAVDGEPTQGADEETQQALAGYRDAMTYVLQVAQDEHATIDEGVLKAAHFMMLKHEIAKSPGRWRPGYIGVRDGQSGAVVYEGPDAEAVPELMRTMLQRLEGDDGPVLVRAAMAHLNLVMIHPYRDGNGRMGRCLQTLVLARERLAAPVFSSIEEYLGRNTPAYYAVLAEVGQGRWNPDRDARPWVRFCLTAHFHQANTQLRRIKEIEELWRECAALAGQHRLPERVVGALAETAMGLRVRRGTYRTIVEATAGESVSDLTASRDLRSLVDADLLVAVGERRGRYYVADPGLLELRRKVRSNRSPREALDPFVLVGERRQLKLGT